MVPPDAGAAPELSVVMVSHGAWLATERAVAALVENTASRFELIVVDNASDQDTQARLSELRGPSVIFNTENRGFGPASNQGAERARGHYLLLLNTDAFVHRAWFDPLLATIKEDGVGAVVPRLLHPDGTLQDAGTLLARDGTVSVYGDGDDADRLCYRFRRVVDVASAACILLRRDVFEALGGFDEQFAPAYYEDTDLCLRLAELGLCVVYEPRATVTHLRYGSGSLDHAVELSDRNRRLFVERWGSRLAGRPPTFTGASEQAVIFARDAPASPRVLICASAAEPGAPLLAHVLLLGWPSARVTWAAGGPLAGGSDEMAGLELVDQADPGWLRDRLFHYDLVVLASEPEARLARALAETQPQAPQVRLSALNAGITAALAAVLARAGIAPPVINSTELAGQVTKPRHARVAL